MTDFRALPGDLCMSDAMPFQQHWEYRTTLPVLDIVESDTFFLPMRSSLRAGDSITVCRYSTTDSTHRVAELVEVAQVRVISSGAARETVPLFVVGAGSVAGGQLERTKPAEPKPDDKKAK